MIPFYIPWKQEVKNRNTGKKLVNSREKSRSIFFHSIIQCLKKCSGRLHIESSPLTCNANQLTDFYMKGLHNILRHYQVYWKKINKWRVKVSVTKLSRETESKALNGICFSPGQNEKTPCSAISTWMTTKCIQNPAKHLRWSVLRKWLMAKAVT